MYVYDKVKVLQLKIKSYKVLYLIHNWNLRKLSIGCDFIFQL